MGNSTLSAYHLNAEDVRQLLMEARDQLVASGDPVARNLAGRLFVYYLDFGLRGDGFEMPLEETLRVIGTAIQEPEHLEKQQLAADSMPDAQFYLGLPPQGVEWGRQFVIQALKEIRSVICESSKEYKDLQKQFQSYPKAFAVAISASVLNAFGLTNPMALGIATLVLLALGQTTKNAFCKMTDQQVLAAIDAKIELERKSKRRSRTKAGGSESP